MHRSDLHNVLLFLTLEDSISSAAGHAHYVEELGAVDHVVVCELVVSRVEWYKMDTLPSRLATHVPLTST